MSLVVIDLPSKEKVLEVSEAILKGLNTDILDTLLHGLADSKMKTHKLTTLETAIKSKKKVEFELEQKYGRNKLKRYKVIIDFATSQVEVHPVPIEMTLSFASFKVVEDKEDQSC